MDRDQKIEFIENYMIGDLRKQVRDALIASDDAQLDDLLKVIAESDDTTRNLIREKLLEDAQSPKIDTANLKKPKDDKGGEQVW